ncbi:MAG: HTH domain-containing protein [Bacteroidales bacterium]|nr:HTH domain-containing protein [Bacteroidales bacterium]
MRTHYMVTSKDLAEEFKMSRREVFRYIKIFKKNNIVKTHRGKYGYIEYIGGYAWR